MPAILWLCSRYADIPSSVRFRTYFPEAYRHLYPNAKTHLSSANSNRAKRTELPDSLTIFEKSRSKKRRPFTKEEDEALREGFEKVHIGLVIPF